MRKLSTKGKLFANAIVGFLLGGFVSSFTIAYITNRWEIFAIGMAVSGITFLLFYGAYTIESARSSKEYKRQNRVAQNKVK